MIVSSPWDGFHVRCNDRWTHYRLPYHKNGRHDQMVRSISVGADAMSPTPCRRRHVADGTLWLATNAGAVSFSPEDRRWVKYGHEFTDGIVLADNGGIYVNAHPSYVLRPASGND